MEGIEAWEVDALSTEINKRGLEPDGVLAVSVSGRRLFPPEHEMLQAEQLESATMKPVAESAETVRREWKHRAREQPWRAALIARAQQLDLKRGR